MLSRPARFRQSESCQSRLQKVLKSYGFITATIGQEQWLDHALHDRIRNIHNDFSIGLIRYFPDLFCFHLQKGGLLIQSKSTSPQYYDGENFSIETASLNIDHALTQIGATVFIIFENEPNDFYYESAKALPQKVVYSTTNTKYFEGSRTPMSLIPKRLVPNLIIGFLDAITTDKHLNPKLWED